MNKTAATIVAVAAATAAFGATVPAPYISFDLAEGTFETLAEKPSEWSFADYETRIVLECGGKSQKGNPFYFAVFDTTVAQWANVMGGTEDEKLDDSTKTGVTKREIRGILPDALFPITYGSFLARLREKAGVRGFELHDRDNSAGTQNGFRVAYFPLADGKTFTVEVAEGGGGNDEEPPVQTTIEPSGKNLTAWLELPTILRSGETAIGYVVYSNRTDSATLSAPTFTISADGDAKFSDGQPRISLVGKPLAPSAVERVEFTFSASARQNISLSFQDETQPRAPASSEYRRPSAAETPFAAILPEGPAPLTTGFVFLGDGRKVSKIEWDFDGDGASDSEDAAPVWKFESVGAYSVSVRVVYVDGDEASWTVDSVVNVWDAPETEYDARTVLVGAPSCDYSIVSESSSALVLKANGANPRIVSAGSIILRHGKPYAPLKTVKVTESNDGTLSADVEQCALTEAYSVLSISSLLRSPKSGAQSAEIYSLPDFDNAFSMAMGEAAKLDMTLTNSLSFACSVDIRTENGISRVRRFYGGIAGRFGASLSTSLRTPDGLVSGDLADATVNFGTPPLLVWAGPKATYSVNAGVDLAVTARGRFAKGVKYDDGSLTHIGGAVLEDFDPARDVKCPLAFADASVFAGLEIGAALGWDFLNGKLAATLLAVSADAGVRADATTATTDGVRSLDVKVRPVVELSFVPVSLSVFSVVDWTPITKNHAIEGEAWTFHWDNAAAIGNAHADGCTMLQTLPLAIVGADETATMAEAAMPETSAVWTDAAEWLEQSGLIGAGASGEVLRGVMSRPSGKHTASGQFAPIWHDYVAGTNPTNANDVFKAVIRIGANGIPDVQPSPKCEGRTYTIEGKVDLGDEWHPRRDGDQFFRIKVKLE